MVTEPLFKPGQRCGEFIIQRLLFRGLSDTYLAAHQKAKTLVYLQCADIRRTGDAAPPEAQWNAALAKLETLRSPFAATLLEAGVHEGAIRFTASEHAPGARIFPMFSPSGHEQTPLKDVLAFGLLVACGMVAARQAGLIHGDLSIHRILVTPAEKGVHPSIRILGIGSVELFGAPLEVVRATPLFRAPEQLLGQAIDARSDIYSLGMLLYTFVAGRLPFFKPDGSPPPDLLELATRQSPESLDALVGCPQLISDSIHIALEKHPDHRYADWMHVGLMLRKLLQLVGQDTELRGKEEKQKVSRERTQGAEAHSIGAHPAEGGVQSGFRLSGLADAISLEDEREFPWGGVEPPSAPPESPQPPTQRSGQARADSTPPAAPVAALHSEETLPTPPAAPVPALHSEQTSPETSTLPASLVKPARPKANPRTRRALIAAVSLVMVSAAPE